MFFVYLKVLGPGQLHLSCIRLADGLLQHHGVVVSVGLHARLVVMSVTYFLQAAAAA